MSVNNFFIAGYVTFLIILLIINLLYFLQVFRFRLPGDVSLTVLVTHIILILLVLTGGSLLYSAAT